VVVQADEDACFVGSDRNSWPLPLQHETAMDRCLHRANVSDIQTMSNVHTVKQLRPLDGVPARMCGPQARVNPKTESPIVATIITGAIIGTLAFFVPLEVLADLVSMG
jgi:hypothetical protein